MDYNEQLPVVPFDAELNLEDLFAKLDQQNLIHALQVLLGGNVAVATLDETVLAGEKRLLSMPATEITLDLEAIGYLYSDAQPQQCTAGAMIIATTTLYSMLQYNATSEKNYVTIEDPVEYYLDMASQVMIKEKLV